MHTPYPYPLYITITLSMAQGGRGPGSRLGLQLGRESWAMVRVIAPVRAIGTA